MLKGQNRIPCYKEKITYICMKCGKEHDSLSEDFIMFYGNAMIGKHGGIVVNNLDEEGKVVRTQVVCRDSNCINKLFMIPIRRSVCGNISPVKFKDYVHRWDKCQNIL